jgi:hypothetical protein
VFVDERSVVALRVRELLQDLGHLSPFGDRTCGPGAR